MDAAAHSHEHHAPMPTSGRALDGVAVSATLHCLTGCAIGEVAGMFIGTALGFSRWGTVALAVALAFVFGYSLTSLPLLRAGMTVAAIVPIALATDTFSIATMEVIDNAIMLAVPGAMEAGLGSTLFWGSLAFALVVAGVGAFPVNRWLISRGKGHAVLHETGIHGGPDLRLVAAVAGVAAVFGTTVLVNEALTSDGGGHGSGHKAGVSDETDGHSGNPEHGERQGTSTGDGAGQDGVRGLAVSEHGMQLEVARTELPRGRRSRLSFRIVETRGRSVRDFEVEHTKRMHLILARRDLTGFQHLHPRMAKDGTWSTPVTIPEAGSYRVFADFKRDGRSETLAADVGVDGPTSWQPLAPAKATAKTAAGYQVRLESARVSSGKEADLAFEVTRRGEPVHVQPYLGAKGHLVALRRGDLAYLHVHPTDGAHARAERKEHDDAIGFATEFPSDGAYRLFLQFKHEGRVHTAAFTQEVSR